MAADPGYTRYQCDSKGCPNKAYAKEGTVAATKYNKVSYTDGSGQTVEVVFCDEHVKKWQALQDKHSTENEAFINGDMTVVPEEVE